MTLAGGAGTRWTEGAGVVKALNPFCKLGGHYRNFIEVHLAKSLRVSQECGTPMPHVITTSYLTHEAIAAHLESEKNYGYPGPLLLSAGRSHRPAHGSHGARSALCLGGDAAADAGRAGAESARRACTPR